MDYNKIIEFLFNQFPIYQKIGDKAYKPGLDNTLSLASKFNNPQNKFKSIHIAGTNGKGSCSNFISSIFQEAGYKTGLYTSPHLKDFRERIKINGKEISEDYIVSFFEENIEFFKNFNASFFEITTMLAFKYFAEEQVDIAIIETGLGGRLDSTNIINPELSVITNIGIDHTQFLGNTINEIAVEKAGIIKPNTAVIIGESTNETQIVFNKKAIENNSPIIFSDKIYKTEIINNSFNIYKDEKLQYSGSGLELNANYQKFNISTVTCVYELLSEKYKLNKTHLLKGITNVKQNTNILGRWQIINKKPLTICDVAHNYDGVSLLVKQINEINYNKLHLVFGTVNDKKIDSILEILPQKAEYYFCNANIPRALDKDILLKQAKSYNLKGNAYNSVKEAYSQAVINSDINDFILIFGSHFIVSEII